MAKKTNLQKLKEMYERSKKGSSLGEMFWKPKDGENIIRILPPKGDSEIPYVETAVHSFGGNILYCPRAVHKECPICQETRLRYQKDTDLDRQIAQRIRARKQYLYNIIDRKSDKPTEVKIYISGTKVWNKIMSYYFDEEYGVLDDVENGYDFKLIKKSQGDYPNYDDSRPFKNPSPLSDDPEEVAEILKNLKDLNSIVDYKSADELYRLLEQFLAETYGEEPLIKRKHIVVEQEIKKQLNKEEDETEEKKEKVSKKAKPSEDEAEEEEDEEKYEDFEKRLEAALAEEDDE